MLDFLSGLQPHWWFVSAAGAAIAVVIGGLYYLLEGRVAHWKQVYEAARAELEHYKANPEEVARTLAAITRDALSNQIVELEKKLAAMKAELQEKETLLKQLSVSSPDDARQLMVKVELSERLLKKIERYEDAVSRLIEKKEFAEQVIFAIEQDELSPRILDGERLRLEKGLRDVEASSMSATARSWSIAATNAAAERAAAFHAKLAERAATEAKARNRLQAALPLPSAGT